MKTTELTATAKKMTDTELAAAVRTLQSKSWAGDITGAERLALRVYFAEQTARSAK